MTFCHVTRGRMTVLISALCFLTFSKGFIVYFDNSFGNPFGCITVSVILVFFQLNNIFESQI